MDLSNVIILDLTAGGNKIGENTNAEQSQGSKDVQSNTNAGTEVASTASAESGGMSGIASFGGMAIYIVGLVALFYFFAIRPQKKREKELKNIQGAIGVGDWVMTSSGFYGKVVDVAEQVFVVEFGTNKGVRIPVRKSEIIGNKEPNLSPENSSVEIEKK